MSNMIKEPLLNIYRQDKLENPKDKLHEGSFLNGTSFQYIPSTTTTSESTLTMPSIHLNEASDELLKTNGRNEEGYQRSINLKSLEMSSWKSDINSLYGESKNVLNFFSLPKFGLCERSTQTMLTGRDIEDLEDFQKELSFFRTDLMSYVITRNTRNYRSVKAAKKRTSSISNATRT